MKRKVKTMQKILEEFPESYFCDEGHLNDSEVWNFEVINTDMFQFLGKEIELNVDLIDKYKFEWREEWLEPLPRKKKIKLYAYKKIDYFEYDDIEHGLMERCPEWDIEKEIEE